MLTKNKNILFIYSISIMAILGIVAVTPALTEISNSLNVPRGKIGLVVSLFALPGIVFTPVCGYLADKLGRKNVIIPSLFIFGIFGTATFFVKDITVLLSFRFVSGIGAASLGAINITLIGDLFREDERRRIVGFNNGVLNLGTTVIPLLGGILAKVSWNYVFILPSLAVALALLMLFTFNEPEVSKNKTSNYFKEFLSALKDKRITIIFLVNFLTYTIFFGSLWNYTSFIIKEKFITSTVINAIVISFMSLTAAITSIFFGKISSKYSAGKLFIFIFLLSAAALVVEPFMPQWYFLFIPMFIFGVGFGLNLPNMQSLIIRYSPDKQRGVITSLNRMFTLLGQFLGPVVSGFILFLFPVSSEGYNYIFWFFAGLCLITLALSQIAYKK
jgi:MFS transporter, ACDE family, multidrug resistance protein